MEETNNDDQDLTVDFEALFFYLVIEIFGVYDFLLKMA